MALNYEGHEATTEPFSGSAEGPLASDQMVFLALFLFFVVPPANLAQLVNFTGSK